jgi:hypothetical protein
MQAVQKLLVTGVNSCGIYVPKDLIIIAATNPAELSTTGQILTPPVASRFCMLEVSLDESWLSFCEALEHGHFLTSDYDFQADPPIVDISDIDYDIRAAVAGVCRRFASGDAPRFNPEEHQNSVPRTMMYSLRCIQAAISLGMKVDGPELSRVLKGLIRNEDVAVLIEALKKRETLTWDKLLGISPEKLAKYNSAQISAVIQQARFDNLVYVSDDGKHIKTDPRLVRLLDSMKQVCSRELIESFVTSAISYVLQMVDQDNSLSVLDWDEYKTFRDAAY